MDLLENPTRNTIGERTPSFALMVPTISEWWDVLAGNTDFVRLFERVLITTRRD